MAAKDALGNEVKASAWLKTHQAGDRSLTQGLKVRIFSAAPLAGNSTTRAPNTFLVPHRPVALSAVTSYNSHASASSKFAASLRLARSSALSYT